MNSRWLHARLAKLKHDKLVVRSDLMVPELDDEMWEWLRDNVRHPFKMVSVGDGGPLEEDYIQFDDYNEFLHFRLRWENA